ncbi:MAG: hypothetical protein RLZZ301_732 [Bacteroidota bacterium]
MVSCNSKQLSFDELTRALPSKPAVYLYKSDKLKYSIFLPNELKISETEYTDSTGFELFLNSNSRNYFKEGSTMVSVLKVHWPESKVEKAWKKLSQQQKKLEDYRVYSEGLTNFMSQPAHYVHSACTISEKNNEQITFMVPGDSSMYYLLSLSSIAEEGNQDQMKKLLYCAKTLKLIR